MTDDKLTKPNQWNNSHPWTTGDELRFLDQIGTNLAAPLPREELLRNYAASMALRTKWDLIDPKVIQRYLVAENEHRT